MLEFLKEVKDENFDAFFFMPGPKENMVRVEGRNYKKNAKNLGGNEMGDMYHIMLFQEHPEKGIHNQDLFEAILIDPLEYISQMIDHDFYGLVAKKTKYSKKFVKETFDKLNKI